MLAALGRLDAVPQVGVEGVAEGSRLGSRREAEMCCDECLTEISALCSADFRGSASPCSPYAHLLRPAPISPATHPRHSPLPAPAPARRLQVLVNPSDEPYFNLLSALSNPAELRLLDLRETSDTAFPAMAQRLREAVDRDGPDGPMGQAQAGGLHGQGQAQGRDGPVGRQGLGQGVVVKKEEQGEEGGSGGSDGEPGGRRKGRGRRGPGAGSRPGSAGGEERLVGNGSWAVGGAAGCMVNGVGGAGLGVGIGNGAGAGGDGAGAGGEGGPKRIKLEPLLLAPDAEQLLMALQAQRALQQHAQRQQQRQRQQQQQQEDEERRRWQEAEEERRRREQEARRRQEEQDTFKLQQLQQRQQQQHQHEQQQRQLLLQLLQQQQQQQQFGDTELGRVAHPQNGSTLLHGRSPVRTVTQDGIAGGGGGCGLATGPGALRQDHRADPHQRPNQALEVAGLSGEGLRTGLGTGVGLHGGLRTGMGVESGGGGVPGGSLGPAALPLGRPGAPWQGGELAGVPGGGAGGAAAAGQGQGQGQGVSVLQALLQQLTGQSPSRQVHQQQPQQQLRQLGEGGTPHASPLKAAAGDQALLQQQPQQQQQQELRNGAAPAAGGGGGGGGMSLLHTLLLHRQGLGEHAGVSPASGVSAALQGMSSRGSLGAAALPSTVTGTTAAAGGLAGLLAQQQQQQQQQHQHHPQHQGFVLDLGASAHFASLR